MSKTTLFDSRIKKYAYREASQIYQDIGASPDGLSHEQVEAMREKYGANSFAERKNDTTIRRLRRAFINPFNIILFILGIISLVTDVFLVSNFARNATTAIIIFSMILISGAIRLIQELRAKNAAQQLDRLIHESITVKREGELIEIPAEELVVGDIVLLSAGDRVPADIRLTEVTDLFISQAAITGESAILEKNCHALSYSSLETLTQLENLAFMATTVISGKGEGIVLAVGKDTLYGSFAKPGSDDKKSFQKGANSIAWVMLRFIAVLIPIVFVLLGITGGKWLESFAFALSVAVGLMPEMLPMVITACLARGSLTMSRKQTIIKDINAMQGFGSMDVLCLDKTGTLTNESILLEYYMDVLGNESSEVLDLAFLNSFYHSGVRNPIDNAILACQTMPGRETHYTDLLTQYQKIDEIPFDYARKFVSTLVTDKNGESQLIMKGDMRQSNNKKSRDVTAFLYERLSREDNLEGESYSISNQKKILQKAAKDKGYTDTIFFVDDGITGTTMKRKDFQRMIQAIEAGYISAVFVKDLSRLGRNYIEVGKLTEEFFPQHDIRLVAVADGVDSDEGEDDFTPFRNIMNEWYAKDISKKRKIVNKMKGNAGIPLSQPPYGYMKNPDDPRFWVIDPDAADVVRRIYRLALEGNGPMQIATALCEAGILNPSSYRTSKGISKGGSKSTLEPTKWNHTTVKKILTLQEYCGDVINFKTYSKSYKMKRRIENPEENRAIFLNVHEPIIDRVT